MLLEREREREREIGLSTKQVSLLYLNITVKFIFEFQKNFLKQINFYFFIFRYFNVLIFF